ncbi:MAG: hypothetical protein KC649_05475, partial [Candidatus Omnitrophica bacterium]|nr:hypothetical protein [Candidatus Omnitrophota bacterium]
TTVWNADTSADGGDQFIRVVGDSSIGTINAGTGIFRHTSTGQIIDGNDSVSGERNGGTVNIIAGGAVLQGGAGVGDAANFLETRLSGAGNNAGQIEAAGGAGGIFVENVNSNGGGLEVGGIGDLANGAEADGNIVFHSNSPLTVNSDIISGADILLTALGNTVADDITVNATVDAQNGGKADLYAGHDIILGATGEVKTTGTGTGAVNLVAGENFTDGLVDGDGAADGSITMADGSLVDSNGAVTLSAREDVALSQVISDSTVNVTASTGSITDNTAAEDANIEGTVVTLTAKEGIGTHIAGADIDLNVDSLNAHVTGVGSLHVQESDDINLLDLDTFDGSINVVAGGAVTATDVESTFNKNDNDISITGTSIALVDVNAGTQGDVVLTATAGSITDGGAVSVIADDLTMTATDSVGATGLDYIDTQVQNIEGSAGTGVFRINNTGALTVGGVEGGSAVTGVTSAGGEILIGASSPLTIDEDVTHSGTGRVTLISNGSSASDNLTINANIEHTGTGLVDLIAGNDIRLSSGSQISTVSGNIGLAAGANAGVGGIRDLDGNANGSIKLADGSLVTTDSGSLTLNARKDVQLSEVSTVSGDATILAESGSITDNSLNDASANLTAVTASLTAGTNIGTSGVADVDINVDSFSVAVTNAGSIVIQEANSATATNVVNANGSIDLRAGGALTATNIVSTTDSNSN